MSQFETHTSRPDKDSVMLKIKGEFSGMDAIEFESQLMGHLDVTTKKLILNLQEVPYIDSAALMLLAKCAEEAQKSHKEIVLLDPTDNIKKVLDITNMRRLFTIIA